MDGRVPRAVGFRVGLAGVPPMAIDSKPRRVAGRRRTPKPKSRSNRRTPFWPNLRRDLRTP